MSDTAVRTFAAADRPVPTDTSDGGAVWGSWAVDAVTVGALPQDDDCRRPVILSVNTVLGSDPELTPAAARRLAVSLLAAADAAEGHPVGWAEYRAESPNLGSPDPTRPGWAVVGPGHAMGPTQAPETFDVDRIRRFRDEYTAVGRTVAVWRRIYRTLTDIGEWETIDPATLGPVEVDQ
ncbi:hypothetical protein [Nocardia transvalensis]|uniref:hypothetical protein n=1 Tax=Nocardia transvalensis TaxID=37333 RepID=UPI0018949964|nr:hypothetical protein [Nocardia transvalensis]MBF6333563.1 hypothetical protein [Nocardia transvalensis]